jgi:MFS transporter, putative metabolite:H+ symporter
MSLAQLIAFGLAMQFFLFAMWSVLYAYTPELVFALGAGSFVIAAVAVGVLGIETQGRILEEIAR